MTGANIAGGDLTRMAVLALLGRGGPAHPRDHRP